jgi:mono/diheme cytochrome c family protein
MSGWLLAPEVGLMSRSIAPSLPLLALLAACAGPPSDGEGTEGDAEIPPVRVPTATLEELNIPDDPAPDSPFADPVFRRGIEAWRRPHSMGACANCHTADASDLAYFAYTDPVILRRAMGAEASPDDAWAIVDLVHQQRERLGFERLIDPTVSFMQPGGEMLEGPTQAHRDVAFLMQLRERGLRLFQPEPIATVEEAQQVVDELLALDIRDLRVGIPFNRWTSDAIRGEHFRSMQQWIPDVPQAPLDGRVHEWYGLQNRYIEDPTPENLWGFVDRTREVRCRRGYCTPLEPLTDNLNLVNGVQNGSMPDVMHNRYRSVQIAGHMMRTNDSRFPEPSPMDPEVVHDPIAALGEEYNGRRIERRHFRTDVTDLMKQRIDSVWGVGASERTTRNPFRESPPEFLVIKTNDHDWDSSVSQVVWMWQGMMYDPALQFSAAGNKTEYFFEETTDYQGIAGGFEEREGRGRPRSQDLALHRFFIRAYMWTHEQYGYDTRYETRHVNGDPVSGRYFCGRGAPDFGRIPDDYGGEHGLPEGYVDLVNRMRANLVRTQTLLVHAFLREHGFSTADADCVTSQIDVWSTLQRYEGERYASLEPYVNELVRELSQPGVAVDRFVEQLSDEELDRRRLEHAYLHPAREVSRPLLFPEGADEPAPPGPISEVYAESCAGCHGDDGGGQMDQVEPVFYPPLTGFSSFGAFESFVRAGAERPEVSMPAFDESRISEEELRAMFERLSQ